MEPRVFAARTKNREILSYSTSGGAFPALTEAFICDGNAVLCSSYNYDTNQPEFQLIHTLEERDRARGSIYVQSIPKNTWREAKAWLGFNPAGYFFARQDGPQKIPNVIGVRRRSP